MIPNLSSDHVEYDIQAISDLYFQAELKILQRIRDAMSNGKNPSRWSRLKYKELRQTKFDIRVILNVVNGQAKKAAKGYTRDSYIAGWEDLEKARGSNISFGTPSARIQALIEIQSDLIRSFDAIDSAVLRDVDDAYRQIIGEVITNQALGISTTQQSIQDAMNRFAGKGIAGFTDKAGRNWNMDSYAAMAVRTSMMRAALAGCMDDMKAHGEHLVIISDHQDTCPFCAQYERSVLAIDKEGEHDPACEGTLEDAIGDGLFHPNCLHSMTPYVDGLTIKSGSKSRQGYTRGQDSVGYSNRQKQRSIERNIKKWKRLQAVSMDEEQEEYTIAQQTKWKKKLKEFTGDNNLPRTAWRERVWSQSKRGNTR